MFTKETTKLGTVYPTPFGELPCCGYGSSGERFTAYFGSSAAPAAYWSNEFGWETGDQQKARVWDNGLAALKPASRAILDHVFGERITAPDRFKLKTADRLVNVAKNRLIKEGVISAKTCGRCGGSGRYSYNQMDGDKCYGCYGSGKVFPSCTEVVKAIKAAA